MSKSRRYANWVPKNIIINCCVMGKKHLHALLLTHPYTFFGIISKKSVSNVLLDQSAIFLLPSSSDIISYKDGPINRNC